MKTDWDRLAATLPKKAPENDDQHLDSLTKKCYNISLSRDDVYWLQRGLQTFLGECYVPAAQEVLDKLNKL